MTKIIPTYTHVHDTATDKVYPKNSTVLYDEVYRTAEYLMEKFPHRFKGVVLTEARAPIVITGYVNLYDDGDYSQVYSSLGTANRRAESAASCGRKRVARVKVTLTEGQFDP